MYDRSVSLNLQLFFFTKEPFTNVLIFLSDVVITFNCVYVLVGDGSLKLHFKLKKNESHSAQ